jgi:hypothetical protein
MDPLTDAAAPQKVRCGIGELLVSDEPGLISFIAVF